MVCFRAVLHPSPHMLATTWNVTGRAMPLNAVSYQRSSLLPGYPGALNFHSSPFPRKSVERAR